MRALVWFRADLRVSDNTALLQARRAADRGVVGVFLLAPEMWRKHNDSPNKIDFLLRNLRALSDELRDRNIPLLIREAPAASDAPEALLRLMREQRCDALYFNNQYEFNEAQRDARVIDLLTDNNLAAHAFHDQTVIEPGAVRTRDGRFHSVFSPFKRAWLEVYHHRDGVIAHASPRRLEDVPAEPDPVPDAVHGFDPIIDPRLWPAGERHAQRRLAKFIDERLGDYASRRDIPAEISTSCLSPYLALGVISPRQCLEAALDANDHKLDSGRKGAVAWISELIWREFYKHILVGFPRVSMGRPFKPETDHIQWRRDPDTLDAWKLGRTGFPIVDAGMRQLLETGWMHNRVRMITAMFLTKDLLLDWRLGETHFMLHLVDGDLASNNGGWQWSASTGTDAAPYFRIFNPANQSRRFDPDGKYIKRYVPELRDLTGDALHEPASRMPPSAIRDLGYIKPIVDHAAARDRAIEAFKQLS